MKYFALLDDLFTFKYLLTEDSLSTLSETMLQSKRELIVNVPISNSTEELDSIARIERNNRIYFDIIRRALSDSSGSLDNKDSVANFIENNLNSEYDTIITNTAVAAFLVDNFNFWPTEPSESSTMGGTPYIAGNIGKLRLVVDPFMGWNDTRMFMYNKSKVNVAAYFESVTIKAENTMAPISETKLMVYSEELSPIANFKVNIPTSELI